MNGQLAAKIRSGEPTVGNWVSLSDPDVVEMIAELEYDFHTIDMEHTAITLDVIPDMARAVDAAAGDTEALVRLPENDPVTIKQVLDIGISGVVVPMVDPPKEAQQAVEATRYPPNGGRGVGPFRASRFGLEYSEYIATADETVLTIVQIESRAGLENVEAIAAVEGVDGLFVGPDDLSKDLGLFDQQDSAEMMTAVERVVDAAHDEGIVAGSLVTATDDINRFIQAGMDFLNVGWDTGYILDGASRHKAAFDQAIQERNS